VLRLVWTFSKRPVHSRILDWDRRTTLVWQKSMELNRSRNRGRSRKFVSRDTVVEKRVARSERQSRHRPSGTVGPNYRRRDKSPRSSSQWSRGFSPGPRKARRIRSNVTVTVICRHWQSSIQRLPETAVRRFCAEVFKRLRENARAKRHETWKINSRSRTMLRRTRQVLVRVIFAWKITRLCSLVRHAYSSDLASINFFFFPKLKSRSKRQRLTTIDEIRENSETAFQKRKRRRKGCIWTEQENTFDNLWIKKKKKKWKSGNFLNGYRREYYPVIRLRIGVV